MRNSSMQSKTYDIADSLISAKSVSVYLINDRPIIPSIFSFPVTTKLSMMRMKTAR